MFSKLWWIINDADLEFLCWLRFIFQVASVPQLGVNTAVAKVVMTAADESVKYLPQSINLFKTRNSRIRTCLQQNYPHSVPTSVHKFHPKHRYEVMDMKNDCAVNFDGYLLHVIKPWWCIIYENLRTAAGRNAPKLKIRRLRQATWLKMRDKCGEEYAWAAAEATLHYPQWQLQLTPLHPASVRRPLGDREAGRWTPGLKFPDRLCEGRKQQVSREKIDRGQSGAAADGGWC